MEKLPETVVLRLEGSVTDFEVFATLDFDGVAVDLGDIGSLSSSEEDGWTVNYGRACGPCEDQSDMVPSAFVGIGYALAEAIDYLNETGRSLVEDEDEDEADDDADEEEEGRDWILVAWNTYALPIVRSTGAPIGCLVRYENEDDPPTMVYLNGVSLEHLLREPPDEASP